jgi:hypothetical protein
VQYRVIQKLRNRVPFFSFLANGVKSYLAFIHYLQAYSLTLRSAEEKREYLRYWQKATGYEIFVETGTYQGRTTLEMSRVFAKCFTTEIDPALYAEANSRFAGVRNITSLLGDSPAHLPSILAQIHQPAVFWLDAHDSGVHTGRGTKDTPIARELAMIFAHEVKNHVILIDDARNFCGVFGYPSVRQLHRFVQQNSDYYMHIQQDVIAIHPYEF